MSAVPLRRSGRDYVEVGTTLLAAAADGATGLAATIVTPPALVLGSAQSEADAATAMGMASTQGTSTTAASVPKSRASP